MSVRTRALLVGLITALLAALAYLPLLRAGLLADDVGVLLQAAGETVPAPRGAPALGPAPLVRLSLSWWGEPDELSPGEPGGVALGLRLEGLLLLAVCALGLAVGTRRLLVPWTGSEHARAAGWSTAVFLMVHPLCVPAVASVVARGELLAGALAAWTLALFLRGRQDRIGSLAVPCIVLSALAGMASDVALAIPFLLAGAELFSAHRYRPLRVRLRTAATTFVVFGLAASFEGLLRVGRVGSEGLPGFLRLFVRADGERSVATLVGQGIEKLGLFVLPTNPFVTEFAGFALAGAVFLLAMHPGLSAARSAPRLWGWVLFAWFVALLASELFHLPLAVGHATLSEARGLFSSVAVVCVGLGIGATALSGLRRVLYPCVVALGYAALAHANALPWPSAARVVSALRADLVEARERHGTDVSFLVLDPPQRVRGVEPLGEGGGSLGVLLLPALDAEGPPAERSPLSGRGREVLGLSRQAFEVLVDQPEFAALRAAGAAVVFEPRLLGPGALELEPAAERSPAGSPPERQRRRSLLLPRPEPSQRPLSWRGTLRSPNLDLEALTTASLLVTAREGLDRVRGQRVSWRGRERSLADGSLEGFWYEQDGEARGLFAVGDSLAWRLADRIKRVWFEGGLSSLEQVSVARELPGLGELQPQPSGDGDWTFPRPPRSSGALVQQAEARGRYAVVLLDLASLSARELPAFDDGQGGLRVPRAAATVRDWLRAGPGPVVWRLELRVDERAVARAQGRRERAGEAREAPPGG